MSREPRSQKKGPPLAGKGNGAQIPKKVDEAQPDYLLANGPIDEPIFSGILGVVSEEKKSDSVILCLVTYGGSANAAYKIGRLLQNMYDDVAIFIPSTCKSAGTLVACSASRLIMSPFGELGPLDVQLYRKDDIFEIRSGLVTNFALEELKAQSFHLFEHFMLGIKRRGRSISFKLAADIASKASADIMANVYRSIDIDDIGDDMMNLRVATEYCERLNRRFGNLKRGSSTKLVHSYPSHDFVIDRDEASTLFERVEVPDATLISLLSSNQREMMLASDAGVTVKMLAPNMNKNMTEGASDDAAIQDRPGERENENDERRHNGQA